MTNLENSKTLIVTKNYKKNLNCDKTQKKEIVTKLKNQRVTKLKTLNCEKKKEKKIVL